MPSLWGVISNCFWEEAATKISEKIKSVRFVSGAWQCHEHKMSATASNFLFAKKEWPEKARNVLKTFDCYNLNQARTRTLSVLPGPVLGPRTEGQSRARTDLYPVRLRCLATGIYLRHSLNCQCRFYSAMCALLLSHYCSWLCTQRSLLTGNCECCDMFNIATVTLQTTSYCGKGDSHLIWSEMQVFSRIEIRSYTCEPVSSLISCEVSCTERNKLLVFYIPRKTTRND
jgi:hypothetical protein